MEKKIPNVDEKSKLFCLNRALVVVEEEIFVKTSFSYFITHAPSTWKLSLSFQHSSIVLFVLNYCEG